MIQISQDDLLRALKRFKGIAKQDLLPHNLTPQSDYWRTHAEARRETYTKLIELVENDGIENACVFAFTEYHNLPVLTKDQNADPAIKGHSQALEMFFNVIGIAGDILIQIKVENQNFSQFLNITSQFPEEYITQSLAN